MFALVVHLDRNSQFYSIVKQQASEIIFQKKTRHGAGENSVDSHPYLTSLPSYFLCVCVIVCLSGDSPTPHPSPAPGCCISVMGWHVGSSTGCIFISLEE